MTRFQADRFTSHGGYLHYARDGAERPTFVARFKYGRAGAADFRRFLIANFTVEEYFAAYDAGKAPLLILESKGYVSPNVRKALRAAGFPETLAGRDAYIQAGIYRDSLRRAAAPQVQA